MKSICLALVLSLTLIANGQQSASLSGLTPEAESRAREVLHGLETGNQLRLALERGERGDGTRHAWMDKMQRLGIKQAAYVVDFVLQDGAGIVEVKKTTFLREYYRYDTQIKDRKMLRQINDSGLELQLWVAMSARAEEVVTRLMNKAAPTAKRSPRRGHATLYLNLLDDEALPILDEMPKVEW